jgi:cytochrome c oxidase subunit IV
MSGHQIDDATYNSQVAAVWKATLWLSIITIVEVVIALLYIYMFTGFPRWLLNLIFVGASLLKAFFIVAEFMHLKYEKRAFAISLGVPLVFLIWAIIAFAVEGSSWLTMKSAY